MLNLSFFLFVFIAAFIATVATNFIARDKWPRLIPIVWIDIFISLLVVYYCITISNSL